MRFGVLGPVAVWTAAGDPVRIPERKVRALLAVLLMHLGAPVSVDRLVADLWGDEPPGNPANSLQTKVSQLRRALAAATPGAREWVAYQPPGYRLVVPRDAVDAVQFETLLTRARGTAGDASARAALLTDALALWRGPEPYADFADDPATQPEIARLAEQRLLALEELAHARLELGEHSLLTGELNELVSQHPLRERLRAAQVRALYGAGRQSEALDSLQDLRRRLADELGLDPSPELVALHKAVLAQDLPSPTALPAASALPTAGTNLPPSLSTFVGRADAVRQIRQRLAQGRLVTLTGPGGVGKTRLAVAAASELVAEFPDGVWLVELAGHRAPAGPPAVLAGQLAEAVLAVLGVREDGDTAAAPGPVDRLAAVVGDWRMLLVLDNCEHVIDGVADLVGRLLRRSAGLRLLATSQEPVAVEGELRWPVPPLAVPDEEQTDPAVVGRFGAVQLFVAKAAAVQPGFTLDAGNAAAVAAICRRLDGIPLALELAAGRMPALGVATLADRLDDRFPMLSGGRRDAPTRHRTLRAMLDWSWQLLTLDEQAVLRRLAVQVDGCTLAAAEAVCAESPDAPDATGPVAAGAVADLLGRLVDRSLVAAADQPTGRRYRLLESVAAYSLDRLIEAGEQDRARERHANFYLTLAEVAEPRLRDRGQQEWLARLDSEAANLRAAFDHLTSTADPVGALRMATALAWYWVLRGRQREAQRSLAAALAVAPASPVGPSANLDALRARAAAWLAGVAMRAGTTDRIGPSEALAQSARHDDPLRHARGAWFVGTAMFGTGDIAGSAAVIDQALATFQEYQDEWGTAAALSARATQSFFQGDLAAARRDGERSAAGFGRLGDRWGSLQANQQLAEVAEVTGDYYRAAQLHRDGLAIARELGLWTDVANKLSGLGRIALLRGEFAEADDLHEQARQLAVSQYSHAAEEFAELGLALSARRQGRLDVAESYLRRWLAWYRDAGSDFGLALLLDELGFIAEQRGDAAAALDHHRQGYAAATATGDPRAVALALEGLSGAEVLTGRADAAAELLGAAAAARASVGVPLQSAERGDVDRITRAASAVLREAEFRAGFARGEKLTPGEAYQRVSKPPGQRHQDPQDGRSWN